MTRSAWIFGGGVALAVVASLVASTSPDGLERVAADLGFEDRATTVLDAPLPDYAVAGLPAAFSGAVAGLLGALVVGGVSFGAGRLLSSGR